MVTKLPAFKTRGQKADARKQGRIDGYFGKVAKGRPNNSVVFKGSLPMNKTRKDVVTAGKKGTKQAHANWNLPGNFHLLKQTVVAHLAAKEAKEKDSDDATDIVLTGDVIIPRTTIQ